jgi:hypothetical protein
MKGLVYYLPGRNGYLLKGLGEAISCRGLSVVGRELQGDFQKATFGDQVAIIAGDLKHHYWTSDMRVIAYSYGSYLFLHAQAALPPFPGSVLLLSPIVGSSEISEKMIAFTPPRARKIFQLAELGRYPTPKHCEIHVGINDWQCNPVNVQSLGDLLKVPVHVVEDCGHMLEKNYVSQLLDKWL